MSFVTGRADRGGEPLEVWLRKAADLAVLTTSGLAWLPQLAGAAMQRPMAFMADLCSLSDKRRPSRRQSFLENNSSYGFWSMEDI